VELQIRADGAKESVVEAHKNWTPANHKGRLQAQRALPEVRSVAEPGHLYLKATNVQEMMTKLGKMVLMREMAKGFVEEALVHNH
jgi:hypothetical protein